jgi:hypothetical protein
MMNGSQGMPVAACVDISTAAVKLKAGENQCQMIGMLNCFFGF